MKDPQQAGVSGEIAIKLMQDFEKAVVRSIQTTQVSPRYRKSCEKLFLALVGRKPTDAEWVEIVGG